MAAYAVPSGTIAADSFNLLAREMVDACKSVLPLDGLLLALHGATVAENFPDADGEMVYRFRRVLGPDVPIIMTLDLHANVSGKMIEHTDASVFYRSNPHLDQKERGVEAAELMARTLRGDIHPVQAVERPPLLINISKHYTQEPPALDLYRDIEAVLQWPGILSASIALGFQFADVEEMGSSFLAVADGNSSLARQAAQWMAKRAWDRRQQFASELPNPAEAVRRAAEAARGPVVLMDVGDNVGGGGPGDSTVLFEEILRQNVPNTLVILFDPSAVSECLSAGVRQQVQLAVGAKTDNLHGVPVALAGKVRLISDGIFMESRVRHGGWGTYDQGITVVLETAEGHTVVLNSLRMAPMSLEQVLSLGIKPEQKKIIISKGVVAPRPAYEPIASEIITVDTPGLTSADPTRFEYHRRRRPLYPLETNAVYPP
jgi:microcystin degradation protein MlrC